MAVISKIINPFNFFGGGKKAAEEEKEPEIEAVSRTFQVGHPDDKLQVETVSQPSPDFASTWTEHSWPMNIVEPKSAPKEPKPAYDSGFFSMTPSGKSWQPKLEQPSQFDAIPTCSCCSDIVGHGRYLRPRNLSQDVLDEWIAAEEANLSSPERFFSTPGFEFVGGHPLGHANRHHTAGYAPAMDEPAEMKTFVHKTQGTIMQRGFAVAPETRAVTAGFRADCEAARLLREAAMRARAADLRALMAGAAADWKPEAAAPLGVLAAPQYGALLAAGDGDGDGDGPDSVVPAYRSSSSSEDVRIPVSPPKVGETGLKKKVDVEGRIEFADKGEDEDGDEAVCSDDELDEDAETILARINLNRRACNAPEVME
ncbi:hypothetical protein BDY21DRAFT_376771 [Lineolata rhizophorae]|uniref:Uncharacterized protein n=1 Tax=Lineolata rhizophorae TaxID=578093 RepID=A0A6A6PAJ7_9PEZI|nr:hypothetical protein BDY21DRAFT_376771 [Lineolata rhizophorae]